MSSPHFIPAPLVRRHAPWIVCGLLASMSSAWAQTPDSPTQELLRQQERERALREQQEATPDVRLERPDAEALDRLPSDESPCFAITTIRLDGEDVDRFRWALRAADPADDPASGRCLGTAGINVVMKRVQNAIMARGFVTTRVLAAPQDLKTGELTLTVVPGRIRAIRFAPDTNSRASAWNAVPAQPGDLLNLRDIEQALENFKRVPTVEADIKIAPAEGPNAKPGESDLLIIWVQSRRFRLNATLDDTGSESTGKLQAGATVSLDHLLTWNDLFYVNLSHDAFNGDTRGTHGYTVHYDVPFGYWQLGATAGGYQYHQTVPGDSQSYVYSGSSHNAEVRLARLLYRNATRKTGVYGRGWWRESDNFIDDTEVLVQRRRMAGWEVGVTHKQFFGPATLDATVAFRHGTGAFDALHAPEELFDEGTARGKLITADAQLTIPFQLASQRLRYTGSWRAQWNRTPLEFFTALDDSLKRQGHEVAWVATAATVSQEMQDNLTLCGGGLLCGDEMDATHAAESGATQTEAGNDINMVGSNVVSDMGTALVAGNDVNTQRMSQQVRGAALFTTTTTHSEANQSGLSDFSRTNVDRVAGLYVTNPGGTLVAMAGRDVTRMHSALEYQSPRRSA